eukprot:TRINITY_DN12936_c0_g1_i1.p1 TRINITY_DN12936_c0_g1~~TRINITY_DN12936_c0_g1_i1.p1  ORF type:complete len:447 (-),score=61.37 TRINITY_DN12936_c0_g1_i1:823-2163(-)
MSASHCIVSVSSPLTTGTTRKNTSTAERESVLFGWGRNDCGQLGLGHTAPLLEPHPIPYLSGPFVSIALGQEHSLVLLGNGTLYGWGANQYGQLGTGDELDRLNPVKVSGVGKIKQVACGAFHSMALLKSGEVFTWGCNQIGQLGTGNRLHSSTPKKVQGLCAKVIGIDCCGSFSVALSSEGLVYAWGYNGNGQLGNGNTESRWSPGRVCQLEGIVGISCGWEHALALSKEGTLYAWGQNRYGQLGTGKATLPLLLPTKVMGLEERVIEFCCGGFHCVALLGDGSLYSWGCNMNGELGVGDTTNMSLPTKVVGISGEIKCIGCGIQSCVVVSNEDEVYSWGKGMDGQLGNGDVSDYHYPIKISKFKEKDVLLQNTCSHQLLSKRFRNGGDRDDSDIFCKLKSRFEFLTDEEIKKLMIDRMELRKPILQNLGTPITIQCKYCSPNLI